LCIMYCILRIMDYVVCSVRRVLCIVYNVLSIMYYVLCIM